MEVVYCSSKYLGRDGDELAMQPASLVSEHGQIGLVLLAELANDSALVELVRLQKLIG